MSKKILIVDDNPNMSQLLTEMLEIFDYESEQCGDGTQALTKLSENKYSLVITDMRMPNMTGLELLEKVKEQYPKLPVVLISGYSVQAATGNTTLQPDGFLAKPFMMADIEKLLNSLL